MIPVSQSLRRRSGFSLVEMIGVLAIIAILAVIIVPKVFSTIESSRVTSAVGAVNSMRTSVTDFAGKYGTVPVTNNNSRIDDLLIAAGILDSRFTVKIGTQPTTPALAGATWTNNGGTWTAAGGVAQTTQSRLICLASVAAGVPGTNGNNFFLDGSTALPAGAHVISAVIKACPIADAQALSQKIDGDAMSQALGATTADNAGKVAYLAANAQGTTDVYIYIAHQ